MLHAYTDHLSARALSRKTLKRYVNTVSLFARFIYPTGLDAATVLDVEEFLRAHPNAKTRHAYRSDLKLFYRWAMRRQGFTASPVDDVDKIKVPRGLPRPICVGDALRAVHYGELRARRAVGLGLFAGLRNMEIAGLDGVDVSLHHRELVVRAGKGGKDRVVPVHPVLARLLEGIGPRGPVIVGRHGGPVRPDTVGDIIRRQFVALGIVATPHQLRHTFGTEMTRRANGNLVVVAEVMGHASTSTTMGYNGWSPAARPIVDRLYDGAA
jgi:integrase